MFVKLMAGAQMTGWPSAYLHELKSTANKVGAGDELIRRKFKQALAPGNNSGNIGCEESFPTKTTYISF